MYTKEQIRHIAEGLIDELREMPDGTRITSAQLLGKGTGGRFYGYHITI